VCPGTYEPPSSPSLGPNQLGTLITGPHRYGETGTRERGYVGSLQIMKEEGLTMVVEVPRARRRWNGEDGARRVTAVWTCCVRWTNELHRS
jgi:hypothetical protein